MCFGALQTELARREMGRQNGTLVFVFVHFLFAHPNRHDVPKSVVYDIRFCLAMNVASPLSASLLKRLLRSSGARTGGCCAFSLVELLVVIGIITLLAAVGSLALGGGNKGASVGQSVEQAGSVVEQARLEAMTLGLGARLVLDNDPSSEYRLRRLAVLVPNYDETTGQQSGWILKDRPVILPEGVFFLAGYSSGWTSGQSYDLRLSDPQNGNSGGACLVLDFDGEGRLDANGAARMVFAQALAPGVMPPENLLLGRQGLLIRRYGAPARFQNVDQMPAGGER